MWNNIFPWGLFPVDIHYTKHGIQIVGRHPIRNNPLAPQSPSSIWQAILSVPLPLQQFLGNIHIPPDDGDHFMHLMQSQQWPLVAACDTSFKDRWATHSWVLSLGNITNLEDNNMNFHGSGPVDGHLAHLSSSRGKLAGLTAILIITQLLLNFYRTSTNVRILCDNKAMVHKCISLETNRLRRHREKNMDLFLT